MPINSEFALPVNLSRWPRHVAVLVAMALAVWCYAPAMRAYFAVDDFGLLAISRLLGQPWLVFMQNHFAGGLYFRPLGFLFWWLSAALVGDAAPGHYAANLVLHLGCVAALYTLLQRLRRADVVNALWAALYGVHPLTIGTALWLSDRFDLLATLFSLLAVRAALGYARRPRNTTLAWTLVAIALGLLSKEIAVVGAVAAAAAIMLAPASPDLRRGQRFAAPAAIALLTLAWVAYRHAVLAPGGSWLPAHAMQSGVLEHGVSMWLRVGAEYLICDPRLPAWGAWSIAVAGALWLIVMLSKVSIWKTAKPNFGTAAALAALTLLPGLIQATVANSHLHDLDADTPWFALIISCRLYHLAFAGAVCALMLLTTDAAPTSVQSQRSRFMFVRYLSPLAAMLVLLPAALIAHRSAHEYTHQTREVMPTLAAAHAALGRWSPPPHGCQIYLLGAAATWGFNGFSDAMIKSTSAQPERLAHCLILTEQMPWTFFMRSGRIEPDDWRPMTPLQFDNGVVVPWLHLGDTDEIYFNQQRGSGFPPQQAAFFEYRDGQFIDISARVHDDDENSFGLFRAL